MWVKKSENKIKEELQEERELESKNKLRSTLKTGLWVFLIAFFSKLLISITLGLNYSHYTPAHEKVIELEEIPNYFSVYFETGLYWAAAFMLLRFFVPGMFKNKTTSVVCDKCFKLKNPDKKLICECGGNFLPLQNFGWVEPEESNFHGNMDWINNYKIKKS